jgi:hypothetical protein
LAFDIGGQDMAFSGSSYFAGIGTTFVAVAIGFAGGALVTTSAVQPPNRLERVTSSAPLPAPAPSSTKTEQPNVAAQGSAPSEAPATPRAVPSQKADSQTAQQPASAEPGVAKSDASAKSDTAADDAASANAPRAPTPGPSAKSEDPGLAKNERSGARSVDSRNSADSRREAYRKRADDRKGDDRRADDRKADDRRADDRRFVDRRRRQDLEDATNTVRRLGRDNPPDEVVVEREGPPRLVERDAPPRYVEERAPRSGFVGIDDDAPRPRREAPPPFGFFGNN